MVSSSGNSSTMSQSHGCEDGRKMKRKQSNRESARRSRIRKQKHMDDLIVEVEKLRNENNEMMKSVNITTQQFLNIEAENCILRAQMSELSQRLQSLNDIINIINTNTNTTSGAYYYQNDCYLTTAASDNFMMMNPMNMSYLNQPIVGVASAADMFQW